MSDKQKVAPRLKELRKWLPNCGYPESVIDKSFFSRKLQGLANKPANSKNILPSTYYSNFDMQNTVKTVNQKLKQNPNESIREIFVETQAVLSLKQPPNLLRLLSKKKQKQTNPRLPQDLFNCNYKNCQLRVLYIKLCTSFKTSNNVIWCIRGHISCQSKNVIYFLKCSSCNYSTTYIGKAVDLRSRMNNHITSCRFGGSTDKFDNYVFYYMQN